MSAAGGNRTPHTADVVSILESVPRAAAEYGWRQKDLKPCVAALLDGAVGHAPKTWVAFTIAADHRRVYDDEQATLRVVRRFAKKVEMRMASAEKCVSSAYQRKGTSYRYAAPGLRKNGERYAAVLKPTCDLVGCPLNCNPFSNIRGGTGDGWQTFVKLGWPGELRRIRKRVAIDLYRSLCDLEREIGLRSGAEIFVSAKELARRAGCDKSAVRPNLQVLKDLTLLTKYVPGSGRWEKDPERRASLVVRAVPVPTCWDLKRRPPAAWVLGRIEELSGDPRPDLRSEQHPEVSGKQHPNAGATASPYRSDLNDEADQ